MSDEIVTNSEILLKLKEIDSRLNELDSKLMTLQYMVDNRNNDVDFMKMILTELTSEEDYIREAALESIALWLNK